MDPKIELLQQAAQCVRKAQAIEDHEVVQRMMTRELRAQKDRDWEANHYDPSDTRTAHAIEQILGLIDQLAKPDVQA
jgi:hypothetical protein